MPLRKIGVAESPVDDRVARAESDGVSELLLLRLNVRFMNVRANALVDPRDPRRSPLAASAFELMLAALGRRKKLKLGLFALTSEGDAGLSALAAGGAIGGMVRVSRAGRPVLSVAVASRVSSLSRSMRLVRGRWRLFLGLAASSRASAMLLRPCANAEPDPRTSVEAEAQGCMEFRRLRLPFGEVRASLPRLNRPKLAKRERDLGSGVASGESVALPRRLLPGRLMREKNLDVVVDEDEAERSPAESGDSGSCGIATPKLEALETSEGILFAAVAPPRKGNRRKSNETRFEPVDGGEEASEAVDATFVEAKGDVEEGWLWLAVSRGEALGENALARRLCWPELEPCADGAGDGRSE